MFKFDVTLDQHDIIGGVIILAVLVMAPFHLVSDAWSLGALGIASGLILASNVPLLAGKAPVGPTA
jgi:hypothetical protein